MKENSRRQQAARTRKYIHEVSMGLFKKHGFNKVTIHQICSACGLSTGAFYHYYKNKDDILVEQYRVTDTSFCGDIDDLSGGTVLEKIIEYMGNYSDKAEKDGLESVTEICHAWLSRRLGFPYNDESAVSRGLCELLNDACQAGEIPPELNTREFAIDILMIARGIIYHWCLIRGTFSPRQKTKETLQAYIAGKITR